MTASALAAAELPSDLVADDGLTVCSIAAVAAIVGDVLHEGLGDGAVALLSGAHSGVLSTVAWSSAFDSRLDAAGGTVVNLLAGAAFCLALRNAKSAEIHLRLFLLLACAFNLFAGSGYFLFSGLSNFGDWAEAIAGTEWHGLWRTLLVLVGIGAYYGALRIVGTSFVRYVGVPLRPGRRRVKLSWLAYGTAVVLAALAALGNPHGIGLLLESALPASAGGDSGLLYWQYYIPKRTTPERPPDPLTRSYVWISTALVLGIPFVGVLGRGITLAR
ncbi:MAG TPA: hypothetical protein VEJ67_16915 [Candidatus Cybelea sp.]|nr:hypothetical protein [Candidatus Cybelea sp.]